MKRRKVSDAEYREAMKDGNNVGVIRSATKRFRRLLGQDDLQSCGLHGLWKTLEYHRDGMGNKFTTSLYHFVHCECVDELERRANSARERGLTHMSYCGQLDERVANEEANDEDLEHVKVRMSKLSLEQQTLIQQHFFDHLQIDEIALKHGCCSTTARLKLARATERLREICTREV